MTYDLTKLEDGLFKLEMPYCQSTFTTTYSGEPLSKASLREAANRLTIENKLMQDPELIAEKIHRQLRAKHASTPEELFIQVRSSHASHPTKSMKEILTRDSFTYGDISEEEYRIIEQALTSSGCELPQPPGVTMDELIKAQNELREQGWKVNNELVLGAYRQGRHIFVGGLEQEVKYSNNPISKENLVKGVLQSIYGLSEAASIVFEYAVRKKSSNIPQKNYSNPDSYTLKRLSEEDKGKPIKPTRSLVELLAQDYKRIKEVRESGWSATLTLIERDQLRDQSNNVPEKDQWQLASIPITTIAQQQSPIDQEDLITNSLEIYIDRGDQRPNVYVVHGLNLLDSDIIRSAPNLTEDFAPHIKIENQILADSIDLGVIGPNIFPAPYSFEQVMNNENSPFNPHIIKLEQEEFLRGIFEEPISLEELMRHPLAIARAGSPEVLEAIWRIMNNSLRKQQLPIFVENKPKSNSSNKLDSQKPKIEIYSLMSSRCVGRRMTKDRENRSAIAITYQKKE